jgi:hypothetical protein
MANQKKKNGTQKFVWGVEEYGTRNEVEHAVAEFCVEALSDADAGSVEQGGELYTIEITARLVGTVDDGGEESPTAPSASVEPPASRAIESTAKRIVDQLLG